MVSIVLFISIDLFVLYWLLLSSAVGRRMVIRGRVARFGSPKQTVSLKDRVLTNRRKPRNRTDSSTFLARLEFALKRADIDMTAREYLTRFVSVTLLLAMITVLFLGVPGALVAIVGSVTVSGSYLRIREQQRLRRFNEGLHDMLTTVANSLRAGHSLVQALRVVQEDIEGPVSDECQRVLAEMQVGVSLEEALARANERIGSEDFSLITTAITIQRQVGGNLAEVLDRIADTIRDRVRLSREVKALTAQGRMSATIFMLLPLGLAFVLYLINSSYMSSLFTSPIGVVLLIVAGISQMLGFWLIRKIVRVEL